MRVVLHLSASLRADVAALQARPRAILGVPFPLLARAVTVRTATPRRTYGRGVRVSIGTSAPGRVARAITWLRFEVPRASHAVAPTPLGAGSGVIPGTGGLSGGRARPAACLDGGSDEGGSSPAREGGPVATRNRREPRRRIGADRTARDRPRSVRISCRETGQRPERWSADRHCHACNARAWIRRAVIRKEWGAGAPSSR